MHTHAAVGRAAVKAEENAVRGRGPCGAGVGTVEADSVGGDVLELAELAVLGGGGDARLTVAGGGDGAARSEVARHLSLLLGAYLENTLQNKF